MKNNRLPPFILPVGAALVMPAALLRSRGARFSRPRVQVPLGAALICGGLTMQAWTVTLFSRVGEGTLAPWDPTRKMVVHGPYRHTRNPMITGVLSVLLGESALCCSGALLAWAAAFFAGNTAWFKLVEEPGLVKRFGEEYVEYRENVPMWLPRLRPWDGQEASCT
jgi:protein-S-isoprenylcysteine O-methyltransferase Ste14